MLSFLHVTLIFLLHVSRFPTAMRLLESEISWASLVQMLNSLLRFYHFYARIEGDKLPIPEKNDFRPTPEEFALRGLDWAKTYFSEDWFENKNIEDENQYKEDASMNTDYRPERILWLGCQLANAGKWFGYNDIEHKFILLEPMHTDTSMTPASPSEIELDSGAESTTDTATIMGDCDADADIFSFASRTSTGLSDKTRGEESTWRVQNASTWNSEDTEPDDMDMEQGPAQQP